MTRGIGNRRWALAACLSLAVAPALAQENKNPRADREQLPQPVYKVAQQLIDPATGNKTETVEEHPLVPALKMAYSSLESCKAIKDYTATMVKRERIGDKLNDHEYMFIKV